MKKLLYAYFHLAFFQLKCKLISDKKHACGFNGGMHKTGSQLANNSDL